MRLLTFGWLSMAGLWAQDEAVEGLQVRTIHQFWVLRPEQKAKPVDFSIDCTVTYFDPSWHMLFVQDEEDNAAYVPYGDNPHVFRVGEAITATGQFVPPNADVSFEHATIVSRHGKPVLPVPATEDVAQHAMFIRKVVTLDGFVDHLRRTDATHLQLNLSVNGQPVYAWVLLDAAVPTPDLADTKVRVVGVYNPKVGPDGSLVTLELMVPSLGQVMTLSRIADEPGFKLPATAINQVNRLDPAQLARVIGLVVEREPGRSITVRDATGQVKVMTGQMRSCNINDRVEAVGYPVAYGTDLRLQNAIFRAFAERAAPQLPPGSATGTIALAADVLKLPAEEAELGRPVWLTGVVTWSHLGSPFFFVHDSSGGICVMRGQSNSMVRSPGRNVEVRGYTAMGSFAPVVVAEKFERVSEGVVPVARQVSLEHALTGVEEAQWVEMRGYLRRVYREGAWNCLELATATSDFVAMLPINEDVTAMVGSVIRLHGVCTAVADKQRRLTGIRLWVPGISYVQVEEASPVDPFAVPIRPLESLGQFETVQSFNRRVRVAGVVLHASAGRDVRLEQGGHSLLVLSRDATPLQPGDRVEAVGFLGRQAGRLTLREAVYRRTGTGRQPAARALEPTEQPAVELDGQLVTVTGQLVGNSLAGGNVLLTLKTPRVIFTAMLEKESAQLARLTYESRLQLSGVYDVQYDEHGRPESFVLRLRSPADVAVIDTPSWWTRMRILAFTGVLALGAVLFLGWITVLRRQVQRQTDQIRVQVEREARLRSDLERAGKLESLGLLAGGIAHDFNNLLTVMMGNISLIRLEGGLPAESAKSLEQAEKAVVRARDLTQQLLTFAKGGAPIRTAVSLTEVVREVAEFALRGSKVSGRFDLPADLWTASVDKGQIGQVVQNVVINAVQAMPEGGMIKLTLANQQVGAEFGPMLAPGRYLRLDIADHGPGIAPADIGRIFDPYFTTKKQGSGLGLATVHSIVKKHAGHITAESQPGRGTIFHIWLPAADAAVSPAKTEAVAAGGATQPAKEGPARILVMDDEDFIRDLACSILRRFGYAANAVADGAAALREYERARQAGQPYSLVILDLTIPGGMGGRQTMEELLKLDPQVKAIVSSGYSSDLVLSRYQTHGFRGMISKPYDVTDFAHTVEHVLKGGRA